MRRLLSLTALAMLVHGAGVARAQVEFIRGDVNRDGLVNLADLGFLVDSFMRGGPQLGCLDAADVDDSGVICFQTSGPAGGPCLFGSDVDALASFLVSLNLVPKNPTLPAPFPKPGRDPTEDKLSCVQRVQRPPPANEKFSLAWDAPPFVIRGFQGVELFLRVTTASPVDGFSLAYLVDTSILEITSVDFAKTVASEKERPLLEDSRFFRVSLRPTPKRSIRLLLVTSLFTTDTAPPARLRFPPTEKPLEKAPLLRIVANVREDAPVKGGQVTLLEPFLGNYPAPLDAIGGLTSGFLSDGLPIFVPPDNQGMVPAILINEPGELLFIRGDSNSDRGLDVSDPTFTLGFLFLGGPPPIYQDAADANDDGTIDVSDPTYTLSYLFLGGTSPSDPFPHCGRDPTPDLLLDIPLGPVDTLCEP